MNGNFHTAIGFQYQFFSYTTETVHAPGLLYLKTLHFLKFQLPAVITKS